MAEPRSSRRKRPNKKLVRLVVILAVILAAELIAVAVLSLSNVSNIRSELTVEAGQGMPQANAFRIKEKGGDASYVSGSDVTGTPGDYDLLVQYEGEVHPVVLHVVDTTPPQGETQPLTTAAGELPEPEDFLTSITDVSQVTVAYKQIPDVTQAGDTEVTLVLTDSSGNTAEVRAVLTVVTDTQPPVIAGVQDIETYQNDAVSYRTGVTVTDDQDANPSLEVDSSQVDLSQPGEYQVTYTASDAAGNVSTQTATVTVREKKDGYVDMDTIWAAVDDKLDDLLSDGMTTREQVEAIYYWANGYLGYVSHSDKSDWRQAGYRMLVDGAGDCFSYYAVCKLMFDRLGIPNIDVQKVKNYEGDSNHYWSLVSVDGGETYYHFDATPRVGDGDYFCLVTDEFLDNYSNANNGSHNRDKSLYPATPTE